MKDGIKKTGTLSCESPPNVISSPFASRRAIGQRVLHKPPETFEEALVRRHAERDLSVVDRQAVLRQIERDVKMGRSRFHNAGMQRQHRQSTMACNPPPSLPLFMINQQFAPEALGARCPSISLGVWPAVASLCRGCGSKLRAARLKPPILVAFRISWEKARRCSTRCGRDRRAGRRYRGSLYALPTTIYGMRWSLHLQKKMSNSIFACKCKRIRTLCPLRTMPCSGPKSFRLVCR